MDKKDMLVDSWKAINEARAKIDAAEAEGRELTAEERSFVDAALDDGVKAQVAVQDANRKENIGRLAETLGDEFIRPKVKSDKEFAEVKDIVASEEYHKEFDDYLRKGVVGETLYKADVALQEGTDAEGGYTVPPEFLARLIDVRDAFAPMLGLVSSIDISTNVLSEVPTRTAIGAATWTAEEAGYTQDADVYGTFSITAHKLARIQKVSEELLADSALDVAGLVADSFGRSFGLAINTALTTGNGSGKPYGAVGRVAAGGIYTASNSTSQVTAVKPDSLIETVHKVTPQYRSAQVNRWVMNDATLKALAQLKELDSGSNQYLWHPGLSAGEGGNLLGYPVVINPDMASMGASAKSILFGDLSHYWVVRRPGMSIQRLVELYAATGQVGFRAMTRIGGDLTITAGPVAVFQNAAS